MQGLAIGLEGFFDMSQDTFFPVFISIVDVPLIAETDNTDVSSS